MFVEPCLSRHDTDYPRPGSVGHSVAVLLVLWHHVFIAAHDKTSTINHLSFFYYYYYEDDFFYNVDVYINCRSTNCKSTFNIQTSFILKVNYRNASDHGLAYQKLRFFAMISKTSVMEPLTLYEGPFLDIKMNG